MKNNLFRQKAVEFQKGRLEGNVILYPSIGHVALTIFITLWVLSVIFWMFNSNYEKKQAVFGWLESTEGIVRIYSESNSGKIKEILVIEGEVVEKGQALITFHDDSTIENDDLKKLLLKEYTDQKRMLIDQIEQLKLIYGIQFENSKTRKLTIQSEVILIDKQIDNFEKRKIFWSQRMNQLELMRIKGHIPQEEINEMKEEQLSFLNEYQSLLRNKVNHQNIAAELDLQIQLLPKMHSNEMSKLKSDLSVLNQSIVTLSLRNFYTVYASKTGIVSNLQAKEGQKANSSKPILSIVPLAGDLEAVLLIPIRAAGFLQTEQLVNIRFDAFPFQKFGIYTAEIVTISETVTLPNELSFSTLPITQPVYIVRAKLSNQHVLAYGKSITLKTGMTLSADIIMDQRSIIEWVLEPILSLKGRV